MPKPPRLRKGLPKPKDRVTSKAQKLRQDAIRDSAAVAKEHLQQELVAAVRDITRRKIDPEVLEHELMMGVVGLEWNRWPKEKLDVIKAAYVINGLIESGNSRRIIPPEAPHTGNSGGSYTALFYRDSSPSSANAHADVFDILPSIEPQEPPVATLEAKLPPPGESIDEKPTVKPAAKIPVVEIGG
jgi:hypothetical protein